MTRRMMFVLGVSASLLTAASKVVEEARKKVKDGKFEEAIKDLEAASKGKPDKELAAALSEAHTAYGEHFMFNQQLPPFRKYPSALREFRKASAYDPNNKKAKEHIATIEGIYKSMGREVPK